MPKPARRERAKMPSVRSAVRRSLAVNQAKPMKQAKAKKSRKAP